MSHQPWYQEQAGADTLVLFLHGLMGSPCQFRAQAQVVSAAGYAVEALCLPGHGGDGWDFARSGRRAWLGHLEQTLAQRAHQYRRIFLVTHSMGGLLALQAALHGRYPLAGLFLIAPSLALWPGSRQAWHTRWCLLTARGPQAARQAYHEGYSLGRGPFWACPFWLHPLVSFLVLVAETRRLLPQVPVPVLAFFSRADETSAYRGLHLLRWALPQAETVSLEHSWHAYYPQAEQEQICQLLLKFLGA